MVHWYMGRVHPASLAGKADWCSLEHVRDRIYKQYQWREKLARSTDHVRQLFRLGSMLPDRLQGHMAIFLQVALFEEKNLINMILSHNQLL